MPGNITGGRLPPLRNNVWKIEILYKNKSKQNEMKQNEKYTKN